jgi:hypothetical protein
LVIKQDEIILKEVIEQISEPKPEPENLEEDKNKPINMHNVIQNAI